MYQDTRTYKWKAGVAWAAQCYPWMSTINSIDGFVYSPQGAEAQLKEVEQRKGFFEDIANVAQWFWKNYKEKDYRKKVSHLGGHLVDYLTGEACHRGTFKVTAYRVADNKYYKMLWEEWQGDIAQALGGIRATVTYEEFTRHFPSAGSLGDVLECCTTYWWLNNKPHYICIITQAVYIKLLQNGTYKKPWTEHYSLSL